MYDFLVHNVSPFVCPVNCAGPSYVGQSLVLDTTDSEPFVVALTSFFFSRGLRVHVCVQEDIITGH